MKSFAIYLVVASVLISGKGCEDVLQTREALPDQEYFFLYEYINNAWGYQHNGWLLDSTGTMRYYEVPEKWMVPSTDAAIDVTGIAHYGEISDSVIAVVDRGELAAKVRLIDEAAKGKLTEPENVMADAGSWSYYALRYDHKTKAYERILVKQDGDWEIDNLSDAAEKIYSWMKEIAEQAGKH